MEEEMSRAGLVELATELTVAWLSKPNNRVSAEEVPAFLRRMHDTLASLATSRAPADTGSGDSEFAPAVPVRKSLASRDHIISLIDGKPYKSLKRHLARNGLTPAQYRERYRLKPDYPMVAESYAQRRRELAIAIGLGSRGRTTGKSIITEKPDAPTMEQTRSRKKLGIRAG